MPFGRESICVRRNWVVHAAITEMIFVEQVAEIDHQGAVVTDESEIFGNGDSPDFKQQPMVWTETQDVIRRVGAIMRRRKWTNVDRFGIRADRTCEARATYLTTILIQRFDLSSCFSFINCPNDRRTLEYAVSYFP